MNDDIFVCRIIFDTPDDADDAYQALIADEYADGVQPFGRYLYLTDEAEIDAIARILEYEDMEYDVEDWEGDPE